MTEQNELIKDFSYLVANEVEVETENTVIRAPEKDKTTAPFFEPSDYLNGALNNDLGYCWSQTVTEIGNGLIQIENNDIFDGSVVCRDSYSNTGPNQIKTIESEHHANNDFGCRSN